MERAILVFSAITYFSVHASEGGYGRELYEPIPYSFYDDYDMYEDYYDFTAESSFDLLQAVSRPIADPINLLDYTRGPEDFPAYQFAPGSDTRVPAAKFFQEDKLPFRDFSIFIIAKPLSNDGGMLFSVVTPDNSLVALGVGLTPVQPDNTVNLTLYYWDYNNVTKGDIQKPSASFSVSNFTGQWKKFALSYEGDNLQLYFDCGPDAIFEEQIVARENNSLPFEVASTMYLAQAGSIYDLPYNGALQQVKLDSNVSLVEHHCEHVQENEQNVNPLFPADVESDERRPPGFPTDDEDIFESKVGSSYLSIEFMQAIQMPIPAPVSVVDYTRGPEDLPVFQFLPGSDIRVPAVKFFPGETLPFRDFSISVIVKPESNEGGMLFSVVVPEQTLISFGIGLTPVQMDDSVNITLYYWDYNNVTNADKKGPIVSFKVPRFINEWKKFALSLGKNSLKLIFGCGPEAIHSEIPFHRDANNLPLEGGSQLFLAQAGEYYNIPFHGAIQQIQLHPDPAFAEHHCQPDSYKPNDKLFMNAIEIEGSGSPIIATTTYVNRATESHLSDITREPTGNPTESEYVFEEMIVTTESDVDMKNKPTPTKLPDFYTTESAYLNEHLAATTETDFHFDEHQTVFDFENSTEIPRPYTTDFPMLNEQNDLSTEPSPTEVEFIYYNETETDLNPTTYPSAYISKSSSSSVPVESTQSSDIGDESSTAISAHWSLEPSYGPMAGETPVALSGPNTRMITAIEMKPRCDIYCFSRESIVYMETMFQISTENVIHFNSTPIDELDLNGSLSTLDQLQFSVHVQDNLNQTENTGLNFEYRPNPVIENITSRVTIVSGGIRVTTIGDNFDSVVNPVVYAYDETRNVSEHNEYDVLLVRRYEMTILEFNKTVIISKTPPLEEISISTNFDDLSIFDMGTKQSFANTHDIVKYYYIGYSFDGFKRYENYSRTDLEDAKLIVKRDPRFWSRDDIIEFDPENDNKLVLRGEALDVVPIDNYEVVIGINTCEVTELLHNALSCRPPKIEPVVQRIGNFREGIPRIYVFCGNRAYFIGHINYTQWNTSILICIATGMIGVTILFFGAILICRCIKSNKRSASVTLVHIEMSEITNGKVLNKEAAYVKKVGDGEMKDVSADYPFPEIIK